MIKNQITLILSSIFLANVSMAEDSQEEAISSNVNQSAKIVSDAAAAASSAATQSVKDNADKSNSMNSMAAITQALTGGLMAIQSKRDFAICSSSQSYGHCVTGAIYAGMSILSFMQATEHKKAAQNAANTSSLTDGLSGDAGNLSMGLLDPNSAKIVSSQLDGKGLEDLGYYNSKTGKITAPNGKSYNVSSFSSAANMKAAGFSDSAIAGALKKYEQISGAAEKKVTDAAGMSLSGGGGGSSVAYVDEEYDPNAGLGVGAKGKGVGLARDPANLAGMQKNYNGEPIGVAADSIFLMMSRRYKVKDTQDSFYNEIEMPVVKRTSK